MHDLQGLRTPGGVEGGGETRPSFPTRWKVHERGRNDEELSHCRACVSGCTRSTWAPFRAVIYYVPSFLSSAWLIQARFRLKPVWLFLLKTCKPCAKYHIYHGWIQGTRVMKLKALLFHYAMLSQCWSSNYNNYKKNITLQSGTFSLIFLFNI